MPKYKTARPVRQSPQDRWLARIAVSSLMRTASQSEGGWSYHVGGRKIAAGTAVSLIRNGLVVPVNDGLLDDATQTYRVADAKKT